MQFISTKLATSAIRTDLGIDVTHREVYDVLNHNCSETNENYKFAAF